MRGRGRVCLVGSMRSSSRWWVLVERQRKERKERKERKKEKERKKRKRKKKRKTHRRRRNRPYNLTLPRFSQLNHIQMPPRALRHPP